MEKIRISIAVGSTRRPKIDAVKEALQCFGAVLAPGAEFEVIGVEVASGVGHTPANRQAMPNANHTAWPSPAEIAEAILYFASPRNRITSSAL